MEANRRSITDNQVFWATLATDLERVALVALLTRFSVPLVQPPCETCDHAMAKAVSVALNEKFRRDGTEGTIPQPSYDCSGLALPVPRDIQ